jgi:uncharacterized protein YcbK (DUF882 family)
VNGAGPGAVPALPIARPAAKLGCYMGEVRRAGVGEIGMNRRHTLRLACGTLLGVSLAWVAPAWATAPAARRLSLLNTHTGDAFADAYWEAGGYVPDALAAINHVMRDHRSGDVHAIDPRLLDYLTDLRAEVDGGAPYQIISGYRSPISNAAMHAASSGVASRSLHMDGRAIDIRVRGVDLPRLRDAAIAMGRGGVGYYPDSDFIHVDTGRVRRW